MGSYRDIMRAPELQAEYNKFIAWRAKSREEKQTLYKGLNVNKFTYDKVAAYIAPFGQPGKTVYVLVEQVGATGEPPVPTANTLGGSYFTRVTPAGANDTIIEGGKVFPKGKLAKMIVKRRGALREGEHKSRITGREYKRYETASVSVFLGKNNATDDFSDAVKGIQGIGEYKDFIKVIGNTITFIPEG